MARVIPDHTSTDYERQLKKLATKGVVQLFNALRQAQKTAAEVEAEGIQKNASEVPLVSKEAFLKSLQKKSLKDAEEEVKRAETAVPFLRDNFSTAKNSKHWNEEDDEEENAELI